MFHIYHSLHTLVKNNIPADGYAVTELSLLNFLGNVRAKPILQSIRTKIEGIQILIHFR